MEKAGLFENGPSKCRCGRELGAINERVSVKQSDRSVRPNERPSQEERIVTEKTRHS